MTHFRFGVGVGGLSMFYEEGLWLFAADSLHDLGCDYLRYLLVRVELHRVGGTPLGA